MSQRCRVKKPGHAARLFGVGGGLTAALVGVDLDELEHGLPWICLSPVLVVTSRVLNNRYSH